MTIDDAYHVAIELLVSDFARLIEAAKDDVPILVRERLGTLESELAAKELQVHALQRLSADLRAELEEGYAVIAAALSWRRDHFGPRLEETIDQYNLNRVSKPR